MELIPAIDLIGGRGVRLEQGDYDRPIPGHHDAASLAREWAAAGVRRLHLVDLEGARAGEPRQLGQVAAVAAAAREVTATIRVQAGGGLRSVETVRRLLETGIDWAILGTAAVERAGFVESCAATWPGRILVSLDLRDGRLAIDGWLREAAGDPLQVAGELLRAGAAGLLVTDTRRDGTLRGPNLQLLGRFRQAFPDAWLAGAGGIGSLDDLLALRRARLDGAVTGLALLTGGLPLPEALAALEGEGEQP